MTKEGVSKASAGTHHEDHDHVQSRKQNMNDYQAKRRTPPRKQGQDRRMKLKSRNFDDNVHRRADGLEIKKSFKVSNYINKSWLNPVGLTRAITSIFLSGVAKEE